MTNSLEKLKDQLVHQRKQFSTPCYVYSISDIERNYQQLKSQLGTALIYSLKANSCLDLLVRCGHVFEDGIEIASLGELNLLASGESPRFINNPSADKNFIRSAIASKCTLIIDNLAQLDLLQEFIGKRPIKPIILRLNHSVLDQFSDQQYKLKGNHFGLDWKDAQSALAACKSLELPVAGFHVFRGSYTFNKMAFDTATAALQVVREFESQLGYELSFVNLGGGFDLDWQKQDFDFSRYRQLLAEFPDYIQIAHEGGRALVGSAGYFVTEIRYQKSIDDQHYAVCDGGMAQNFLLAKTESAFKRYQEPVIISQSILNAVDTNCLLVGTSCNKEDVIGEVKGILPKPGDLALFENCGAYNASYTVAPFLSLPTANTYLVE